MPVNNCIVIEAEKHIDDLINIARKAGKEILSIYNTQFDITIKPDRTPVTLADERSNQVISSELEKLFSVPVIAEESDVEDYAVRKYWKQFWLVDPLDGTKEFIRKSGEFCINIAFIREEVPVLGLIYLPVTDTSYYNIGIDLYKQCREETTNVEANNSERDVIKIISGRSYHNPQTAKMIEAIHSKGYKTETIIQGSAIKFCLLAEGKADLYPRLGTTMEWDTAAGHALLEATGGKVISIETGEPLLYNKESLKNPDFIAASKSVNHLLNDIL